MHPTFANYYEANISLLKKHQPAAWESFSGKAHDPVGEIAQAADGQLNLMVALQDGSSALLHDPNNPAIEVSMFLEMIPEKSTAFAALLGLGLGYSAIGILQNRPHLQHLAVFEADPGIFAQALRYRDLAPILTDPRLILSIGPAPDIKSLLAPASKSLTLEDIHTLTHSQSLQLHSELYAQINTALFSALNDYNVGGSTKLVFGREFIQNRINHMTTINHNYLLENLHGVFKNTPAILVAGGPSLDKNIEQLAEAKNKAVIIAVDSVLPALLKHGITPDFVTSIDPTDFTYEKIAPVAPVAEDISLICMPWVGQKVPKFFPAERVFWCFSGMPMEMWLGQQVGANLWTTGAQTVAHLNFVAAIIMGCSPIVFVGQDLAYTDSKDHASHTVLTARDLMNETIEEKKNLQWVEGVNGGQVATDRAFLSMKAMFERMITDQPAVTYINATEGGAHIAGTEILPLKETLQKYCSKTKSIQDLITEHAHHPTSQHIKGLTDEFAGTLRKISSLKKLIQTTDKSAETCIKGLLALKKKGKRISSFNEIPQHLQEKITKIDSNHQRLDNTPYIWHLLEDVTLEGLRQSERLKREIAIIGGDKKQYMEWVIKNLKRFCSINAVRTDVLQLLENNLRKVCLYHKQEQTLLRKKQRAGNAQTANKAELAQLYFDAGNIALARPLFEDLLSRENNSAAIHYYIGAIAGCQTDFKKMEKHFKSAEKLDTAIVNRIKSFRQQLGDQYLGYKEVCLTIDTSAYKKMLFKGLRYCPGHTVLQSELKEFTDNDIQKMKDALAAGNHEAIAYKVTAWHEDIQDPALTPLLSPKQLSDIYLCHGRLASLKEDMETSFQSYKKALDLTPNDPGILIYLMDILFITGNFDEGIMCLEQAVNLDKRCAQYWESIGDTLHQQNQQEDALSAYERCFINLPSNFEVLRKMGECYQHLGMASAAQEAHQQYQRHVSLPSRT